MLVERQLRSEGSPRRDLGREQFIQRVWNGAEYGGAILDQMAARCFVDWQREYSRWTRTSRAVREVLVRLHEQGLIYRGKYIVNWCPTAARRSRPRGQTREVAGKLYEIAIPLSARRNSSPGHYPAGNDVATRRSR
jgi:valyl-tRNA synthetase